MSEFNPSEHNIPDVNAHLEKNPSELQAVLDAEKAGKNRPTLVSELEERVKGVPTPVEPKPVEVSPAPTPVATTKFFGKEYEVTPEGGHRMKKS